LNTGKRSQVALPAGYKLHWYEILSVLGHGGFGITYRARDTNLDHVVAIKEFLPGDLAVRTQDSAVHPVSEDEDTFRWGLDRFIREARTLVKFKHPNIVTVYSVFEANGTAYMVMEYERGLNIEQLMKAGVTLVEEELLGVLHPLLDGLELVHEHGFIHRDIKPENVLLRKDGSPVLIDFGSARESLEIESRGLTTLVTPGYAPFEQYQRGDDPDKQGPWTDVYSMAATAYRVIAGEAPVDALARVNAVLDKTEDPLPPAIEVGAGHYSRKLLEAIDKGLAFEVRARPQSVSEWRDMLPAGGRLPDVRSVAESEMAWVEWESMKSSRASQSLSGADAPRDRRLGAPWIVWGVGAALSLAVALWWWSGWDWSDGDRAAGAPDPIEAATPAPGGGHGVGREVGRLLREAEGDLEALRLTTPPGDNAFERYRRVLEIEPGNARAERGLEAIVERYLELARDAVSARELADAERYVERAAEVLPEYPALAAMRETLRLARNTALAGERSVAVLPFWGRRGGTRGEMEGVDYGLQIGEFVQRYLSERETLSLVYSYYDSAFDRDEVGNVGELWAGDAVRKEPDPRRVREIGRALDADAALLYSYWPKAGPGAMVAAYLVDVGDGRIYRREGDTDSLAELTQDLLADWRGAPN